MILRHKTRQSTAKMSYKFQASQQYAQGKGVLTIKKDKTFPLLADDNPRTSAKSRRRNFYLHL